MLFEDPDGIWLEVNFVPGKGLFEAGQKLSLTEFAGYVTKSRGGESEATRGVAGRLDDLKVPPGTRLEALEGRRTGQFSIRINDQWRVCFRWTAGGASRTARASPVVGRSPRTPTSGFAGSWACPRAEISPHIWPIPQANTIDSAARVAQAIDVCIASVL